MFLLTDAQAINKKCFQHLDIEHYLIFKLIALPKTKHSQASAAAAPGHILTDNYTTYQIHQLAHLSLFLVVFQSPPKANISFH